MGDYNISGLEKILVVPTAERSEWLLGKTEEYFKNWVKKRSNVHIDMPGKVAELLTNQDISKMIITSHKSLWEMIGTSYVLEKYTGDIPYIAMGSNLIKGGIFEPVFRHTMHKLGVVYVERGKDQTFSGGKKFFANVNYLLKNKKMLLLAPEGTRTRIGMPDKFKKGFATLAVIASAFGAMYIFPVNTDYSQYNFAAEGSILRSGVPYKLNALHLLHWRKHMEDIYVSFGEPLKVDSGMTPEDIAIEMRDRCLNLVKILPVNIIAEAATRELDSKGDVCESSLYDRVIEVKNDLNQHSDRFRGFDSDTAPQILLKLTDVVIHKDMWKVFRLYSGYINHYMPKEWQRHIAQEKKRMENAIRQ